MIKPIAPDHLYPHMQYGLQKYYAVRFRPERRVALKKEAIARFNEIHNILWKGNYKFYGFDGEVCCSDYLVCFKEPVTLLTIPEFLALTDNHFNPPQK